MKIIKIIIATVLFLIALALGAENQQVVTFNYLIAQDTFHLSTLLGVVFAFSFGLAWLIFGSLYFKSKLTIHRLRKKLHQQSEPAKSAAKLPQSQG